MQRVAYHLAEIGFTDLVSLGGRWMVTCKECGATVMLPEKGEDITREDSAPKAHYEWHIELTRILGVTHNP